MSETSALEGWAILELFGHRRLAGYVSEQTFGGGSFLRIDVPGENGETAATQLYGASAVYCLTPTSEDIARRVARSCRPAPVQRWELPALPGPREEDDDDEDER